MHRPDEGSVVKESVGWAYLLFKGSSQHAYRGLCSRAVLLYRRTLLMCVDYVGRKALGD